MGPSSSQSRSVGIVIPAFNEAQNLPPVLNLVCSIDWLQQIIVVDDGSTDATFDIVESSATRDSRVLAIRLPENQGKAAARLAGFEHFILTSSFFWMPIL